VEHGEDGGTAVMCVCFGCLGVCMCCVYHNVCVCVWVFVGVWVFVVFGCFGVCLCLGVWFV